MVVAITDGGTNFAHPDLLNVAYNTADPIDGADNDADGWVDNYRGRNTGDNNNNPQYNVNHGVAVTGLSSATTNNNVQVAGVGYQCSICPYAFPTAAVRTWAASRAFSMRRKKALRSSTALGRHQPLAPRLEDVTRYAAINKGCLVVSSAGNSNNTAPFWPASYEWVTGVAGSNASDIKSRPRRTTILWTLRHRANPSLPRRWPRLPMWARALRLQLPIVSGAAALVKSVYPAYTPEQIDALLKETSFNLYTLPGNAAYADKLGRGRLDIGAALTTAPGPR